MRTAAATAAALLVLQRSAEGCGRGREVSLLATGASIPQRRDHDRWPEGRSLRGSSGFTRLKESVDDVAQHVGTSISEYKKAARESLAGPLGAAPLGLGLALVASGFTSLLLCRRGAGDSWKVGKTVHCDAEATKPAAVDAGDRAALETGGSTARPLAAEAESPAGPAPNCADGGDSSLRQSSVLCPGLVVRRAGGMDLSLTRLGSSGSGMRGLGQPGEVVEARSVVGNREVIARGICTESDGAPEITVESSLRLPIAILRLRGDERVVEVLRASPPPTCGLAGGPPFCIVREDAESGGLLLMRPVGGGCEPTAVPMATMRVRRDADASESQETEAMDFFDGEGRCIAAVQECWSLEAPNRSSLGLLHVCSGADAGLVMVAVLAARALGRFRGEARDDS